VDTQGSAVAEVRLTGPPIALTAVVSAREAWLHVEQVGSVVRVTAEHPSDGATEGALLLAGPTGESVLPVRLQVAGTSAPERSEPVPAQRPALQTPALQTPALQTPALQTPAPQPPALQTPAPQPPALGNPAPQTSATQTPVRPPLQAGDGTGPTPRTEPPWWALAAIAAGAVVLFLLNRPGPDASRLAWHDDATGWGLPRSWSDTGIWASVVIGLCALLAFVQRTMRWHPRWSLLAFGVVAGCSTAMVAGSLPPLLAGTAVDRSAWVWTAVVAAGALAVVGLVAGPFPQPWPVAWLPAAGVLAGAAVVFAGQGVKHPDGISYRDVTWWGVLTPITVAALGWAALATRDRPRARYVLVTAALVNLVLGLAGTLPGWTKGDSPEEFLVATVGYLLAAAAIIGGTLVRPAWSPDTPDEGSTRYG
jgi:hypothetical protein